MPLRLVFGDGDDTVVDGDAAAYAPAQDPSDHGDQDVPLF